MTKALPVHVTVVIPTRNEEEAIVDTIRSIPVSYTHLTLPTTVDV